MPDNTKQKKLARERQARTGESYTTALMHVRVEALATRSTDVLGYVTKANTKGAE